ncbi:MAG TPA: hypothetical protein VE172_14760 [Stackebrandtia sp.]|jgi:hypothetical protein|uniref:hypothetical protein n=1 Tax=Stackebrandtia sp. TaxID=2023065 RepID=UPI002D3139D1|nr:hypothetical protein [Stackebrandtia sp.]HZE40065.1 hypothetical protein [Stackebrandtia sp.]
MSPASESSVPSDGPMPVRHPVAPPDALPAPAYRDPGSSALPTAYRSTSVVDLSVELRLDGGEPEAVESALAELLYAVGFEVVHRDTPPDEPSLRSLRVRPRRTGIPTSVEDRIDNLVRAVESRAAAATALLEALRHANTAEIRIGSTLLYTLDDGARADDH